MIASIEIKTLDNPGWLVLIRLDSKVALALRLKYEDPANNWEDANTAEEVLHSSYTDNWYHIKYEDDVFQAAGDPMRLTELLLKAQEILQHDFYLGNLDRLRFMENWFEGRCDADWEHSYGANIESPAERSWFLEICIIDTEVEGKVLVQSTFDIASHDNSFVRYWSDGSNFVAEGTNVSLGDIILVYMQFLDPPVIGSGLGST